MLVRVSFDMEECVFARVAYFSIKLLFIKVIKFGKSIIWDFEGEGFT